MTESPSNDRPAAPEILDVSPQDFLEIPHCTAFNLRKASRAVSQLFDDALRDSGLRAGQFTILSMVLYRQPIALKALADHLVMDRTTLTRNLKPLEREGLLRIEPGTDRRVREVSLTDEGLSTLKAAYPRWKQVQSKMMAGLGAQGFQDLMTTLRRTLEATGRDET